MSRSNTHRGTKRSSILKRRSGSGAERVILFIKRFGLFLAVISFLGWAGSWLILSGYAAQIGYRATESALNTSARWGFAVNNILVDGRVYTGSDTLKAMTGVERGAPILAFNPASMKAEIEKLSWVKKAHVERRLPDTLYIRLEERTPLALWQRNRRLSLIDEEGVVLTDQNLERWKDFLIVVGDDAPKNAAGLLMMLEAEPVLRARVEAATFVAGRRWDLRLKSGADVKLPEEDMGLALRRLAVNHEEEGILDKDVLAIDVREEGRITVRTKPGAAQDFGDNPAAAITPAAGKPI
jgi:cell division protein FtsQ